VPGLGDLAALAGAICWGVTTLLVRHEARRTSGLLINALSVTLGCLYALALMLGLWLLGGYAPRIGPAPLLGVGELLVSVLLSLVLGDSLYFLALPRIGVAPTMSLSVTEPLFTAVFAVLLLGEAVSIGLAAALVLIPLGLYLVTLPARGRAVTPKTDRANLRLGIIMAVGAPIAWGLSSVALRPALDQFDPLLSTAIKTCFASVGVWLIVRRSGAWRVSAGRGQVGMALGAATLSAASILLFTVAVQQAGAARATTLSATSPLYTVPLAALLLGESVTPRMLVGTALTVAGVVLVVAL